MSERTDELEDLIHRGRLDEVMDRVSVAEIAEAWCASTAQPPIERPDDDPNWWAISFFMTTELWEHPALHRAALLALVDAAPDDRVIGNIGAGPIEDFISDDADDLAWLEVEAASRPKLAAAIAGAWVARSVSAETMERLDRIAGVPLSRPLPREQWPPGLVEMDAAVTEMQHFLGPGTPDVSDVEAFNAAAARFVAADEAMRDERRRHGNPATDGPSPH